VARWCVLIRPLLYLLFFEWRRNIVTFFQMLLGSVILINNISINYLFTLRLQCKFSRKVFADLCAPNTHSSYFTFCCEQMMVKLFAISDGSIFGIWVRESSKCWNIPRLLPSISFPTHFLLPKYSTLNTESTPLNETGSSELVPLDGNRKIISYVLDYGVWISTQTRDYSLPCQVQSGCFPASLLSNRPFGLSPPIRTYLTVCYQIMTRCRMSGTPIHSA
jgi:hypothetical protein